MWLVLDKSKQMRERQLASKRRQHKYNFGTMERNVICQCDQVRVNRWVTCRHLCGMWWLPVSMEGLISVGRLTTCIGGSMALDTYGQYRTRLRGCPNTWDMKVI